MNEIGLNQIAIYLGVMSLIGFVIMGIDKRKAVTGQWRISENTLLLIAIIGGGIGSFLGMQTFRHKTKKIKFKIVLPLTALIYAAVCLKLFQGILL